MRLQIGENVNNVHFACPSTLLLAAAAVFALTACSPQAVSGGGPPAVTPAPEAEAEQRFPDILHAAEGQAKGLTDEYTEDVNLTLASLVRLWTREFARSERPYTSPSTFIPYDSRDPNLQLPCAVGGINAWYCGDGDALLWDEPRLMRPMHSEVGDFATALILAHEWGHAIQARLGVFNDPYVLSIEKELQADCLAGVWARYAEDEEQILEDGDIDEAIVGLFRLRDAVGTPWLDPNAHGTASQRIEAFHLGYRQGTTRCLGEMPRAPKTTQSKDRRTTDNRAIGVGQYQLMVPRGAAVEQLPNGTVQLQHSQGGGITAHLGPRYNLAAVPTHDQFAFVMANWNTEQPMRPTGQIFSIDQYTHLGGFALGRFYEQSYQATDGSSLIHGLFILHVGGRGQGLAIDVFTSGGAQGAQDWDAIGRYAGLLLQSLHIP